MFGRASGNDLRWWMMMHDIVTRRDRRAKRAKRAKSAKSDANWGDLLKEAVGARLALMILNDGWNISVDLEIGSYLSSVCMLSHGFDLESKNRNFIWLIFRGRAGMTAIVLYKFSNQIPSRFLCFLQAINIYKHYWRKTIINSRKVSRTVVFWSLSLKDTNKVKVKESRVRLSLSVDSVDHRSLIANRCLCGRHQTFVANVQFSFDSLSDIVTPVGTDV